MASMRKMMAEEYEGKRFVRAKEVLATFGSNVLDTLGRPGNEIYKELKSENWQEELNLLRKYGGIHQMKNVMKDHVEVHGTVIGRAMVGNPSRERPQTYSPDLHLVEIYDVIRSDDVYKEYRRTWVVHEFDQRGAFKGPFWFEEYEITVTQDNQPKENLIRTGEGSIRPSTQFAVLEMLQPGIRRDLQ